MCRAKAFDYGASSFPVGCADESISNDKMRLTLNLGDDASYPIGHPLVIVFFIVPEEKCRQAEVIVFCVNMM